MQTNQDNLSQVWGKPVKSVHSLQDLPKLVQQAEVRVEPVQKEVERPRGRAITKPEIHEAARYALAHPEETYVQVAAKFGVNPTSLSTRIYRIKHSDSRKNEHKRKATREELAARLAKARAAKAAKAEKRKKNGGWLHATLSTSATPVKGIPREAQTAPLTIDYITRMNFNYNIGRAIECLSNYDLRGAMAHLERELNK